MKIEKGDRIDLSSRTTYKALKEFELLEVFKEFGYTHGYASDTLTESASGVVTERFTDWLVENKYIKESAKATVSIRISDLFGDDVALTASRNSSNGWENYKIPLIISCVEKGQYTSNCRWAVGRVEKPEPNYLY